jgi:hypothetical protein
MALDREILCDATTHVLTFNMHDRGACRLFLTQHDNDKCNPADEGDLVYDGTARIPNLAFSFLTSASLM